MSTFEPHRQMRLPDYQTGDMAVVLGARPGNIGGAISERLVQAGWGVWENDCANFSMFLESGPEGKVYTPPVSGDLEMFDACVITLGTTHMEPFSEVWEGSLYEVIYGSLMLPLECARRYVHARKERAMDPLRGKLVFIGSYAHDHVFTHCTSYCTAKAGLDMAAHCLAWELMSEGFDVHIVHPHHVQGTPMTEVVRKGMKEGVHHMSDEEAEAYQRKDLRMPDLLKPGEIADMVYWLLTASEARWVSGTGIKMYGGCR